MIGVIKTSITVLKAKMPALNSLIAIKLLIIQAMVLKRAIMKVKVMMMKRVGPVKVFMMAVRT